LKFTKYRPFTCLTLLITAYRRGVGKKRNVYGSRSQVFFETLFIGLFLYTITEKAEHYFKW